MPSLMCEHPELQAFLEGKIPSGEEQPWLDHLESCPKCQARIEEMAADRNWWQDARTFLSTDSGIAALATPVETAAESEEAGHEPISLDFLAPTDDPESLGRLGTYEVTGVIGRGGSGIVLKAFDRSLNRNVAIKVLSPHLATSGAARKRFAREGQAAAAVVHEHVIPIFAVAAHQNLPYIVMQYFPGRSLQQRLDRDGPLELREILRIGLQTARGLAAAHAQGLIHRDVKPANILLADGIERVTLSDFGLARALDDARLTRTGWLAGTPEYMSPEQSRGKGMDARSDLFSLGSVLYTASTGRVPFQAETSYGTLRQVTDDEPAPIRQVNADIPEWLCILIGKLMAKAPENRFASAEEVANLLEACLAHVQQPESTQLPESLIVKKPQPQRASFFGGRTLVALLLGFAGFIAGGFALWQVSAPPDIAGRWTGEDWGQVQLKHLGSGEYEGTYTDTFGKAPGTIHLNWSRIERRFFGTWREGEDRFGELSIRLVKDEIRGALITDAKSKINPATPRLADLLWVKEGNQTDSGSKIAKKTIQARLQGHWQVTWISDRMSGVREYVPTTEARWIFSEDRLTIFLNDKDNGTKITFELINDENPFLIDLVNGNASSRCVGIVEENKIRFCMGTVYRPAKKAEPTDGLKYFELARLEDAPAAKPTIENTGALQDQGVRSLVQKGDRTAIARERAIALENAREKEVKHDQELKLQSAIRGTWIPSVHNDGLFKIREFQAEFPPPVWRIEIDRIIFETNPKIEAAVEVLEAKVPALLQLTYANQAKQFLRIDSQNSKLLIASSTKRAPEKAVRASDCEYWELKKVVDPLVDRNWAIKVDARDSDLKSQATLPPSKDLLFPRQPLPKVPAPNLVFAWKEGEQNRQDLKPMSRVYGKQEWAGYIKGVTIKLTWSYLGRTVTKVGPDAEIYEINATESIKGVDQKTWNKKVTFNGQPVKVFENEGFSITMAPSQMPAYPTKAANEYPGMAAMLQKITASQSMTYNKHIKSSFWNENIVMGIKIRNQFVVTERSDSGKKQETSYYDTIRNVALAIDYKSKEASYRKIDGSFSANLDVRCKLSALGELPSNESSNEIMDGFLCRRYAIYDVIHKNRKASEIILWINQLTNMPLKMVESVTGDSDREITTTWPNQADLPEVPEESVAMPGFSGAKNYALYAEIYGSKSKSQSDSSSPPTSGPAAIEIDERHKTRILDQLQGNWVTVKKALGDGKDRLGHDAEVWMISGNKIRFGSSEMFSYDIKIIEGSSPVKVDLILNVNKDEDKITLGKIADKCLIQLEENKIVLCQSVTGSRPSNLGYGDGWVYYEFVRIPKAAETASAPAVEAPKVQNELFKQVPYLDRLFAKPNREPNANNPPWEEYRLNRGPRLICHQGPIETNGYFGIHLTRRVEDRVVTCSFGGTSYRMYWKFLGRVPFPAGEAGDVYEIKRRAPANAENPVLSSRIVVYRGSRVKVFDDGNPSVIIEAPDFQDPAPEIADGKQAVAAMIKKLEDIRSLECQLTIAERDQPEKTLQYYRRGDQVCLEEPEKRRMIWDFKSNRIMNLDLAKKTATMFDLNQPSLASEGQRRDAIDVLTVLRSLTGHPANYELTEKVQGLYCDLYHVVPAKTAAGPWALWLNQTTHLPSALQGCLAQNTGTYYLNEFRWNPNLKDNLFTMEIPAGFTATGTGDSWKAPEGEPKDGAGSQGSLSKSHAAKLPTIRIRTGSGPFAQIIERPLEVGNVITNYKLGNPGMEWEVTCQAQGKRTVDCGPSPEVFELQWKFMGDNRLPAQKTGSQTAFLIGKATKAVDEPDFGIELIPSETDARIAGASGAKTSFVETIGKISGISTAILSTKFKRDNNKTTNNITYIKGKKSIQINGEDGTKTIASIDNISKKNIRINDSLKMASIDKSENNRHVVWDDISLLKNRLSSWDHEYIYSETVHNKICDLYRIWPSGPSTIPYNHLSFIWIDQATKLPVLSSSVSSSGAGTLTEFQWDRSLSDSLFSLEIPQGYSLVSYEEFMKQSVPGWVEKIKRSARGAGVSSDPMTSDKQGILANLQGRWKPVLAYRGLTKLSDESARREFALEISKDRLEFVSESDGSRSWMIIELNNDENPFQMDLVREHVSGRCVGVVEGNKLKLCHGTALRPAKKAEPTEGLDYAEYERTDRLPHEQPKIPTTLTAERGATRWNDPVRYPLMRVLEAYQGEWTVARHVDENLHALDVSQTVKPDEPWIVFGESFTVAGMPADHIQATFTVPGKPMKIELMFKSPLGQVDGAPKQKAVRVPSIWSVEGERMRVILGQEGKVPEKLEPTQGFKYFELTRAEKRPRPKPSNLASSGASTGPQSENPDKPNGAGPNLVIVQTAPGDAGRTVEPMGQDERQMVRIVGNGANQTEIRWSYQGKLSFEPGFEVPIYELQWKYLGTHPPALQKEGSKTVYFQGLPIKLAHFSSIQFTVESAQNEPRLTGGSKPKSSFEGMIARLSQAKSCILDHQIFEKTDKTSVSNVYWIKNQSIRFCNSYGFEKTIKDDRALNKRLTLISSSKLAREVILPKDQQLYSGEIKDYFEHYRTRKSKFLYSTTIDSKKCDVYQALPKENDKDSAATQPLFWIEQGTNLPLRLREPGFSGNYHDVQFQLDVPIDEAAFSAEIPPGFALEKKGEIDRLERRYLDWYQRGLKIGVPLPNFKNLQAEKKAKAAEIQGTWQVVKKINDDFRDEKITDAKKQTWTIQGDELTSGGEENQKARIDVVDIWPIFSVNFIPQSTGLPNNLGFPLKASGRIPSLWSLQGGKLRVAIGKEGQPLWKLEPAVGVQYFELVRKAEGPSELDPRAASPLPETIVPKGKGPNLVIVYSIPGDTWKTVEPMGQDPQQMVRIVGNEANQTEIRWAYQGTLVLADGSKIPIYEFQWKYLGSAPAAGKAADAIVVYFQGNRMKLVDFPGISLFVAPTGNDKNGAQGANSNRSFDASFEWVVQAKSCTAQVEIFAKTDRISTERIFWTASKYAETEVRHGFETVAKGDSQRNKQIVMAPSMKLLKERTALQSRRSYEGPLSEIAQFYRNQPAEFLRADTVDGKSCDIYQVYAKVEDGAQKRLPSLFWIEQSTKRLIKLREPLPFGYFRSVSFQIDAVIDPAVWAMNVPAEFVPDQNDEIARQIKMLDQHFQKGLKLGQPAPQAKNLSADVKRKRDLIQGSWVPVKTIDEKYRDVKTADLERTIWTIEENRLIMGGSSSAAQKMEILDAWPIFQVELTRDPRFALNMLSSRTGPVPSLWSLDDQVLRVAIGEQGKPPLRLGPAPGVRYFELVRLTMSDSKELSKSMGVDLDKSEMPKAGVGSLAAGASSLFADQNSMTRAASDPFIPRNFLAGMLLNQEPVKKRILAALEGEWVTTKHVEQNTSGKDESSKPGVVWILQGDSFASSIAPGSPIRMAVIDSTGPTRIEFYLAVSLPRSDGSPSLRIIRVPSLWTLVGNQLKVAIGKEGQKLDRLEPAPGVKYFELVRKPAQSKSDQASPQNPAASHWLFPWAVANGPKPEVTTEKANPTFNLPSSNPDHLPQTSATRASTVVAEIKKDEILSQISGRWVVSKQSRWNRMTGEVVETTGDVWEITGEKLTSLSRFDLSVELEVMATEPHLQIDWIYPGPNRLLRGPFNSQGGRVASLWAIEKGKLKVVILEGGRYPEKLEPGLGCIYFELIPKEPAIPTAGFPAEFQGQWKLTKTIGIDLREESFNRDAMVTIARNQLQIGKEVKKAELVQSGNPFRMNLIAPMPMAAEEVRVPSLWELRGDRLCFNSGKELPAKVGPSPGIYYFELTRVVEPKHSNPGEPGNPLKAGTASQRQGDSGPAADAAKAASFQKMVERLKNAQSASFEVTHANQPGLPQVSATARHLIRGKQVRIDQMIEGTVLVTRIVDSALKKGVLINHNNKTAKEFDFSKTGENIRRTPMDINFLRMLVEGFSPDKDGSQLRRSEVKIFYLRTENLEGKACDVYRVFPSQADDENKGGPWMVWVDSQSHDLVSIRGQARSETFTLSHFQWNLSLDDSSFKLDVPQGFQIADHWIDAWAAKLESTRPLPARKMEPPQKRDANKNAAPDGAASKQPTPQLHPMQ